VAYHSSITWSCFDSFSVWPLFLVRYWRSSLCVFIRFLVPLLKDLDRPDYITGLTFPGGGKVFFPDGWGTCTPFFQVASQEFSASFCWLVRGGGFFISLLAFSFFRRCVVPPFPFSRSPFSTPPQFAYGMKMAYDLPLPATATHRFS